mmetsp:Transcript_5842/g.10453  ORF Transcript_5842/g.10453 Transcript_5842/m.10453 type:complete len:282 (+) Transcript_5842:166-1011(+)
MGCVHSCGTCARAGRQGAERRAQAPRKLIQPRHADAETCLVPREAPAMPPRAETTSLGQLPEDEAISFLEEEKQLSKVPAESFSQEQLATSDMKNICVTDLFNKNQLEGMKRPALSKHLAKTLGQLNLHYSKMLSVRMHEFKPEKALMEAIVTQLRPFGWLVALYEYCLNPTTGSQVGKGDLVLVHQGSTGKLIALAVEAKILSQTNLSSKRVKVRQQASKYAKEIRKLLSYDKVEKVFGLPLVAWRHSPDKILLSQQWTISPRCAKFLPTFPKDSPSSHQ